MSDIAEWNAKLGAASSAYASRQGLIPAAVAFQAGAEYERDNNHSTEVDARTEDHRAAARSSWGADAAC